MYWSLFLICMSTQTLIAQDFTKQISYINTLSEKNLVDEWMPIWEYYSLNPIDLNNNEELEKLMNKNQLKIAAIDIKVEEKYWAVFSPNNTPKGYVKMVEIRGRKKSNL